MWLVQTGERERPGIATFVCVIMKEQCTEQMSCLSISLKSYLFEDWVLEKTKQNESVGLFMLFNSVQGCLLCAPRQKDPEKEANCFGWGGGCKAAGRNGRVQPPSILHVVAHPFSRNSIIPANSLYGGLVLDSQAFCFSPIHSSFASVLRAYV